MAATLTAPTGTRDHITTSPIGAARTMRAIVQKEYGTVDVLRSAKIDPPSIAPNEVLVQVRAAGLKREWIKLGRASRSRLPPCVPLCATAARVGSLTRQPLAGVVDQCASR